METTDRQIQANLSPPVDVQPAVWVRYALSLAVLGSVFWLVTHPGARSAAQVRSAAGGSGFQVVAAENFWGSIAAQEAGSRAQVTSLIANPNADPHAFEPQAADARVVAGANYVILNGAGYDPWGQKLLSANPVAGRRVLIVADLVGKGEGDNPHLWYNPAYVGRVAAQITADYERLDPVDAAYFGRRHAHFVRVALQPYVREISRIAHAYHGTTVGATESVFQYLAQALRLHVITPPGFMKAMSEGTEPVAQDRATFDQQVAQHRIKVLVFNRQNATPDVTSLESKAVLQGIPIVPITETLAPASATFQAWQVSQLKALAHALARAAHGRTGSHRTVSATMRNPDLSNHA